MGSSCSSAIDIPSWFVDPGFQSTLHTKAGRHQDRISKVLERKRGRACDVYAFLRPAGTNAVISVSDPSVVAIAQHVHARRRRIYSAENDKYSVGRGFYARAS